MNWSWQKLYGRASEWLITHGPRILLGAVILIIGIIALRIFNRWLKKVLSGKRVNPSIRYFLQNFIIITLQIMLVILVLQMMGIPVTFLSAIIAGLTVAVGLALSGTLQNFVSGILILFLRPFRAGDTINTQGQEGIVTEIELFYTEVLTHDNKTIIIPNGQLSNNVVINLSREGKRRVDVDLRFGYNVEIAAVKKVMLETARKLDTVLDDPAPRVGVSGLETDKYVVTLNAWIGAHGFYDTRIQLQEQLVVDLKQAGIKLPGMV